MGLAEPSSLSPQIIDDTFKVYDECFYSADKQFYNCDCVAVRFMTARQNNPTGFDLSIFINSAKQQCVDTAPFAGKVFDECIKNTGALVPREFLNDFCECTASQAGKEFAHRPTYDFALRSRMMQKVYKDCGLDRYNVF